MSAAPPDPAVRATLHAQAVASARRILGTHRGGDAVAVADLIVAHWEQVSAACVALGELLVLDLTDELHKRLEALVTASTVAVSVIALEALGIAVHGSRHGTQ